MRTIPLICCLALTVGSCAGDPQGSATPTLAAAEAPLADCPPGSWLTAAGAYPGTSWPADSGFPGPKLRPAGSPPPTVANVTECDFYNWSWQIFMNLSTVVDGEGNLTAPGSIAHNTGAPDSSDGLRFLGWERGENLENPAYVEEIIERLKSGESTKPWALARDDRHDHELPRIAKTDEELVAQAGGPDDVKKAHGVLVDRHDNLVYYGERANGPFVKVVAYVTDQYGDDISELPASYDFTMSDTAFDYFHLDNPTHFWPTEVKTSWRLASAGDTIGDYIAIEAQVAKPVQDPESGQYYIDQSLPNPTLAQETLLLTGFHVAGAVNGHPELIWATFEHVDTAPDLAAVPAIGDFALYVSGTPASGCNEVTLVTSKTEDKETPDQVWLSLPTADGGTTPLTDLADLEGANICRLYPSGLPPDVEADGVFPADAAQQLRFVGSLNDAVESFLGGREDVRRNYRMIGALWTTTTATQPGQPDQTVPNLPALPIGFADFSSYPTLYSNQAGTPFVANMTMESFTQEQSCLTCHNGNDPGDLYPSSLQVSHIVSNLFAALPPSTE